MSTDHQADQEPTITTGLSIAEAADHLGISENAVRQRIKRGTLPAAKVDGIWSVTIIDHAADRPPTSGRDHEAGYQNRPPGGYEPTSIPAVSPAARAQLAAIRDEFVQPLVEQIAAQAEQIGRLSAEVDQLRAQAAADEAACGPETAQDAPAPAAMGQDTARGVWDRLRAVFWRRGETPRGRSSAERPPHG